MAPTNPPDLIKIAAGLVRKGGPEALTMDSLAEAAGVSRATLYRQIGSREALLAQLAERGLDVGDRSDVRERILTAAATVFPRLGLESATVESIAEAAGVGSATVYRHFGDKKGLIQAFLGAQSPRRAVWALAREPSGELRQDLETLARTALEFMTANGGLFRLALLEQARPSGLLDELMKSPDRTVHACTALMRHYLERGELRAQDSAGEATDPQALARVFLGQLIAFGLLGPLWGFARACEPTRDARFIVELFLRGARGRAPTTASSRSQSKTTPRSTPSRRSGPAKAPAKRRKP